MKKLFAIITVLGLCFVFVSCSADTEYDTFGVHSPIFEEKTTPAEEKDPEPEPEKEPEQEADSTQVQPGFWGTVIEKYAKLISWDEPNGKYETVIEIQDQMGEIISLKDTLNFSISWEDDLYTNSDTLTTSYRQEFVGIYEQSSDWSETDSISIQTVEKQYELRASTFTQTLRYEGERSRILINGQYEPFLSILDYVREGDHNFSASFEEFEKDGKMFERELNIVAAKLVLSNVDKINVEGKAFVDREIAMPEPEEPAPAEEPTTPTQEPETPAEEPAQETPAQPEINPDFEIAGLKSFIAWTMVMDGNDKFHDCLFFDCGDRWAALVDQSTVLYFKKSIVDSEAGYNSLNYDPVDGCWVPAMAYKTTKTTWSYDTVFANGQEINRSCDLNYACLQANNNFSKNHDAETGWKVDAQATTSNINGKVVITITAHKVVINKDYRIVFAEK